MIEYALRDINDTDYEMSDVAIDQPARHSITFLNDRFKFDSKVVENSSLPGAIKLGKTRLMSNTLQIELIRAHPLSGDYRDAENEFIMWCEKAIYLVDLTNDRRMKVNIEGIQIGYDAGGHKLSSNTKAIFRLIDPFWETITEATDSDSLLVAENTLALTNTGFLKTYPIVTFTTAAAVDEIEMWVDETNEGIVIEDVIFGTGAYLTMICDCLAGTLLIGTIDRSASIVGGTGYFSFPVGAFSLKITPSAICDILVEWRIREYV